MVEVLVTVVILAVGLLGIAALQFMSKRSNYEAMERTTATLLANDIIERMRYNPKALKSYTGSLETPNPSLGYGSAVFDSEPSPECSVSSTCTKDQLAVHDLWAFEQALLGAAEVSGTDNTGGLSSPTACLLTTVPDALADRSGRYSVVIVWRGQTELSDPANPITPAPSFDPYTCGRDTGALGSGIYDGTTKNSFRRILIVDTYISEN